MIDFLLSVPSGEPVVLEPFHFAIIGQTQFSGKTTLIKRLANWAAAIRMVKAPVQNYRRRKKFLKTNNICNENRNGNQCLGSSVGCSLLSDVSRSACSHDSSLATVTYSKFCNLCVSFNILSSSIIETWKNKLLTQITHPSKFRPKYRVSLYLNYEC